LIFVCIIFASVTLRSVFNIFKPSICVLDRRKFKLQAGTITHSLTQADRYAVTCRK